MEQLLVVMIMIVIGAAIGGFTNHLAIKMLFQPHEAKYIFGKRVPFTPGLIPKRREELAVQMGKMVVEHLVTPESLKRKLQERTFQETIQTFVNQEITRWLQSEKTVNELAQTIGYEKLGKKAEEKLQDFLRKKYEEMMDKNGSKSLADVLPPSLMGKGDQAVSMLAAFICEKAVAYFGSDEGKQRLEKMIDDFLMNKGMLGNMVQMFLGNVKVVDKVQPEIIKFFKHEGTRELFENLFQAEWEKIKEKKVEEIESLIGRETILSAGGQAVRKLVSIDQLFNKSIRDVAGPLQESILQVVPAFIERAGEFAAEKMEMLMQKLKLEEIVREQVESFSVERLEEMVLSISRREFKMITYLGALLGGIIGAFQGVLALFI
ncbi:DUF445 domain-containing protein [Priestia abyssalis]|uniref:DUF445 domain-containing protein n=1 Tax=Priestia abyssalis TaxID=1221450 RepID=UPI00099532D4|nr:DUF445 family protein [Priestia abyssalis]